MKFFRLCVPLLYCLPMFYSSCSKSEESGNEEYFISARVNNQNLRISALTMAFVTDDSFSGAAFPGFSNSFPSFNMEIRLDRAIAAGLYQEVDQRLHLLFKYQVSANEIYTSQVGNEDDFRIQITEMDDLVIKGTFNGTIRNEFNTNQALTVTNGQFYLKR